MIWQWLRFRSFSHWFCLLVRVSVQEGSNERRCRKPYMNLSYDNKPLGLVICWLTSHRSEGMQTVNGLDLQLRAQFRFCTGFPFKMHGRRACIHHTSCKYSNLLYMLSPKNNSIIWRQHIFPVSIDNLALYFEDLPVSRCDWFLMFRVAPVSKTELIDVK